MLVRARPSDNSERLSFMVDNDMVANVRGGALVGAGFGGIIGAVIGWILASTLVPVPVIGPVVGQGVLSTALVAMLAGVAAGALLGALVGVFSRSDARDYAPVPPTIESAPAAPLPTHPVRDVGLNGESTVLPSTVIDTPSVPTFEVADQLGADVPVDGQTAIEPQASSGTPVLRVRRRRQPPPDSENKPVD
jgi:hypothetical protein